MKRFVTLASVLFAGSAMAADSEWTEDGSDTKWSSSANWTNGVPSFGDTVTFSPDEGPGTQTVDFDVTASVGTFIAKTHLAGADLPIALSFVSDLDLRMTGRSGTSLNAGTFNLYTNWSSSLAGGNGNTTVRLIDMDITTDRLNFVRSNVPEEVSPSSFVLILNNTDFHVTGNYALDIDNSALVLSGGSRFTNDYGAADLDLDEILIRDGSILSWGVDTFGAVTVSTGGGYIEKSSIFNGTVTLVEPTSNLTFGTEDSTGGKNAWLEDTVSGTGSITVDHGFTLVMDGVNTFSGGLYLKNGVVEVERGANTGSLSNTLHFTEGTLRADGNFTLALASTFDGERGTIDTKGNSVGVTGDWAGDSDATFVKQGSGTLTLNNNGSGFAGSYLVEEGWLVSGSGDTFSDTSAVTVLSDGILRLNENENFAAVAGDGRFHVSFNTARLYGNSDGSHTFSGELLGSGAIVKAGTGTQTIDGDSTAYTGRFAVRDTGVLNLVGTFNTTDVTIGSGARLGGNADINSTVTAQSLGTLGAGMSAGHLTVDGLVLESGSIFEVELGGALAGEFDTVLVEGDSQIFGELDLKVIDAYIPRFESSFLVLETLGTRTGTFSNYSEGGVVGEYTNPSNPTGDPLQLLITYQGGDGNDIVLYTVPEPTSLALLGIGGLMFARRRRA